MVTGSPSEVATVVLGLAESRPPTAGASRVIAIDGPSGSGKSMLADAIIAATGAQAVRMDYLMEGWDGLRDTGGQLESILRPLAAGSAGSFREFDWGAYRFTREVAVPVAPLVVIEGVGSGNPVVADLVTVLVWIEADDELRFERGMARDGWDTEPQFRAFMRAEVEVFDRDRTRERADLIVAT